MKPTFPVRSSGAANLESPRPIHYAHDSLGGSGTLGPRAVFALSSHGTIGGISELTRRALFAGIAAAICLSAGTAFAASPFHSSRATAAPSSLLALTDYSMQPPGEVPEGGDQGKDSTDVEPRIPEPQVSPAGQDTVPQQIHLPAWASPDSTGRGSRPAFGDTIGAQSVGLPFPASGGAAKPGAKPRRGVFGLHPAALLVGMIALHIFVVGLVSK